MDCNTCKNDRRLQLRAKMNCRGYKTQTRAAEQLAWNNVDSHWPVSVDWTGGAFVRAQRMCSCQMNKCHFTIIMSCVQSTLRNPRYGTFGKYSNNFGFRKTWISVTTPQFTIIMSCLQSTSSIHTSEHSINIRTNIRTNLAFGKIQLSDNFHFRTYVILHCLNQIQIFLKFSG